MELKIGTCRHCGAETISDNLSICDVWCAQTIIDELEKKLETAATQELSVVIGIRSALESLAGEVKRYNDKGDCNE